MGYLNGAVYQNKPRAIDTLKTNITKEIQAVTGDVLARKNQNIALLSGRKWWPIPAHVMMSSHFLHNERTPVQISLKYLNWF
jgi:hypothetical protein